MWKNFAGLNVLGFNPTEVFTEVLLCFLGQKCLVLKRGTYTQRKTFTGLLKTAKTVKI